MNETQYILKQFAKDFAGHFLAFGEWPELTDALSAAHWKGLIVDHMAFERVSGVYPPGIDHIHGPIAMSPHYMDVGQQYKMRAVTFREILDSFAGPFNVIVISVPGLGKDLATCADMWTCWPRVICVRSEGREQEILNLAAAHSYTPVRIERDAFILSRYEGEIVK